MLLSTPEAGFDLTQHVVQSIGVPLHNPNKTSKYNWVVFVVLQRDAKERFLECHTVIRPNNPKLNCLTRVLKATGQKSHSSLAHFPFLQMSAHTIFFFFLVHFSTSVLILTSAFQFLVFYMPIRAEDTVPHLFQEKKSCFISENFYYSTCWSSFIILSYLWPFLPMQELLDFFAQPSL